MFKNLLHVAHFDSQKDVALKPELSGLAVSDEVNKKRGGVEQLLFASGSFCYFGYFGDKKIIFSDPYGYEPVFYFYSEKNKKLYVSNRLPVLYGEIRKDNNLNIDSEIAWTHFNLNHPFFCSPFSSRQIARGVRLLEPDQALLIYGKGYKIKLKSEVFPHHYNVLDGLTYESLLNKGIEKSVQDASLLMNSGCRYPVVSLTGGKDSRALLSIMVAAGLPIQVYTKKTEHTPEDLEISAGLVKLLGLSWYEGDGRPQYEKNFDDALKKWSLYRSGQYFVAGIGQWETRGENNSTIEFAGGGGEVLRTYWPRVAEHGIRMLINKSKVSGAEAEYIDELVSILEEDEPDRLEARKIYYSNNYFKFRNRFHFGAIGLRRTGGELNFHLLSNVYFKMARDKMKISDAESGKLIFDIVEKTMPFLNHIKYDGGRSWGSQMFKGGFYKKNLLLNIPEGDFEAWNRAEGKRKKRLSKARSMYPRIEDYRSHVNEVMMSRHELYTSVIKDNVRGYQSILQGSALRSSSLRLDYLIRLQAISDVYFNDSFKEDDIVRC